jgi:hypothetical protein
VDGDETNADRKDTCVSGTYPSPPVNLLRKKQTEADKKRERK